MKFKTFLVEGVKEEILKEFGEMSETEIFEFGEWLYTDFLSDDEEQDPEDVPEGQEHIDSVPDGEKQEEDQPVTKEEISELLDVLSEEDLVYIYDMLEEDEDTLGEAMYTPEEIEDMMKIDEAVARKMATKNIQRKKRKFVSKTKADLRREAPGRKRENRAKKASRKRSYRKNKVKKAAYSKSRTAKIKKGVHKVKMRRRA